MMVSVGFIIRVFYGHENVACDSNTIRSNDYQINSCQIVSQYYNHNTSEVYHCYISKNQGYILKENYFILC